MIALANRDLEWRTQQVDLRRKETRRYAEVAMERAAHATPEDRAILEAVYEKGIPATRIAELMQQHPRRIRRRVRDTIERLMSREAEFVLRHRDEWERNRRLIASACILQGRSMRDASRHLRLSLHLVRREMQAVRSLMDKEVSR